MCGASVSFTTIFISFVVQLKFLSGPCCPYCRGGPSVLDIDIQVDYCCGDREAILAEIRTQPRKPIKNATKLQKLVKNAESDVSTTHPTDGGGGKGLRRKLNRSVFINIFNLVLILICFQSRVYQKWQQMRRPRSGGGPAGGHKSAGGGYGERVRRRCG